MTRPYYLFYTYKIYLKTIKKQNKIIYSRTFVNKKNIEDIIRFLFLNFVNGNEDKNVTNYIELSSHN